MGKQNPLEGAKVTKKDLLEGFRKLGIMPGTVLEVHSSLSSFGYVEGGALTVIDALVESVGIEGSIFMPASMHIKNKKMTQIIV